MDWNAQIHILHVVSLMLGTFAAGIGVGWAAALWRIRETRRQLRGLHRTVKGAQVMKMDAGVRRRGSRNERKRERQARKGAR